MITTAFHRLTKLSIKNSSVKKFKKTNNFFIEAQFFPKNTIQLNYLSINDKGDRSTEETHHQYIALMLDHEDKPPLNWPVMCTEGSTGPSYLWTPAGNLTCSLLES